jgi:hypothetical protein
VNGGHTLPEKPGSFRETAAGTPSAASDDMRTTSKTSRLSFALCACSALFGIVGCDPRAHVDGTRGELGKVDFKYQRSCFFGCPLEQPLLSGARERIEVSGAGDQAGMAPHALDPDVAEFALERECFCERDPDDGSRIAVAEDASCKAPFRKHCDNHVLVEALAPGTTKLELRDAAGDVIDRVELTVADAHRARFSATLPERLGKLEGEAFELSAGQSAQLELTLYDERGFELLAPDNVTWHVADGAVATVSAFLLGSGQQVEAGLSVQVDGKAEGETDIAVDVPGLQAQVSVRVLP